MKGRRQAMVTVVSRPLGETRTRDHCLGFLTAVLAAALLGSTAFSLKIHRPRGRLSPLGGEAAGSGVTAAAGEVHFRVHSNAPPTIAPARSRLKTANDWAMALSGAAPRNARAPRNEPSRSPMPPIVKGKATTIETMPKTQHQSAKRMLTPNTRPIRELIQTATNWKTLPIMTLRSISPGLLT